MPSTPSPATFSCALESHGRISVDSEAVGVDEVQLYQDWLDIKAERGAKEKEAITVGRRTQKEIRARPRNR